jgi:putative FmdB family regulatory protein
MRRLYNLGFCAEGFPMPIYAYRCSSCGHAKDVLQKMSDAVLTTCPACGAETYAKQVTAAGFQLKGSGWYVTDFKGGAAATTAAPASPKPAEGGGGDSSGGSSSGGSGGAAPAAGGGGAAGGAAPSGGSSAAACGGGCACH